MLHRSMSVVRLLDQLAEPRKKISVDDCEEEDMFMAFLICNVDSDTDRLLVCKMALILRENTKLVLVLKLWIDGVQQWQGIDTVNKSAENMKAITVRPGSQNSVLTQF
ncbi:hypothetical protein LINGRAHAP2_LOCUS26460 [Linum grandiflorum]